MKKLFYIFISVIIANLMIGSTILYSQEEVAATNEAKKVLERYFNCLKNGNTSEILNLITGPLLKKREGLLRNNSEYGGFLRNHYKDAYLVIMPESFSQNGLLSLRASIYFNAQDRTDFIFNFVSDGSNGSFKIYSEEEIP